MATTIGLKEEAVVPALLVAAENYSPGDTVLIEPLNDLSDSPLLGACVRVSCRSLVVPLLYANLSARPVTIPKNKILADEFQASLLGIKRSTKQLPHSN